MTCFNGMRKRESIWIVESGKVSLQSPSYTTLSKVSSRTLQVPEILFTACAELQSMDLGRGGGVLEQVCTLHAEHDSGRRRTLLHALRNRPHHAAGGMLVVYILT